MKKIGILGGMSWESTVTYYQMINRMVNQRFGGLHSANCLISSVNFHEIEQLQAQGVWEKAGEILGNEALNLERAGADGVLLATNTMHKVAEQIEEKISVPFLHIVDAVAEELDNMKISRVGLLGTKYTLKLDFFKDRLKERNIDPVLPSDPQIDEINRIIFEELVHGELNDSSKDYFIKVMQGLKHNGAEAIVLGCTEIGLLIKEDDFQLPLIDTTTIHAKKAVEWAIQ
ncbi:aspartate/glutamate racemase family protein [Allobacillus halotolerans]|uniref:Aspartate/glutamate racemase family protein n=1 Tax=Allobacillus halotolerans TaxID=570278 RepID=A0ABS6GPA4_9BACI|nr:aspartate/glutamate racemase family protein [Allobacillus halotolerans]MBU6080927.1 aspartate/glutamate racemase family protein [Allobacillus halotolerans]